MTTSFFRPLSKTLAALAVATSFGAAHGAEVMLSGWAYGTGNEVRAVTPVGDYNGVAGGFIGTLAGTAGYDATSFITYCIELEEHFYFGDAMAGYRIVEGARYFLKRHGDASIAQRLGLLMTYADDHPELSGGADGSTALQLAIWNTIYDNDDSLAAGSAFRDSSAYQSPAEALLVGASTLTASRYDVLALERSGSQDFMLLQRVQQNAEVPEPGSLALVGLALGALVLRRRVQA